MFRFLTSPQVEKTARAALYASMVVFVLVVFLHRDFVDAAVEEWVAPIATQSKNTRAPADTYAHLLASAEEHAGEPSKKETQKFSEILDKLDALCPRESRKHITRGILGIHHQTRREGRPLTPMELATLMEENIPQGRSITCVGKLEAVAFLRRL